MIIFFFLGGTTIFITPYIRGLNTLETGNQHFVSNDFSYKFSDFEFSQRLKVEKYLVESWGIRIKCDFKKKLALLFASNKCCLQIARYGK